MNRYYDPMQEVKLDGKKYQELVSALKEHDVAVIQKDSDDGTLARDGYIGLFSFKNLTIGKNGSIALELVDRLADAKK